MGHLYDSNAQDLAAESATSWACMTGNTELLTAES